MKLRLLLTMLIIALALASCKLSGEAWVFEEGEEHNIYNLINHVKEDPFEYVIVIGDKSTVIEVKEISELAGVLATPLFEVDIEVTNTSKKIIGVGIPETNNIIKRIEGGWPYAEYNCVIKLIDVEEVKLLVVGKNVQWVEFVIRLLKDHQDHRDDLWTDLYLCPIDQEEPPEDGKDRSEGWPKPGLPSVNDTIEPGQPEEVNESEVIEPEEPEEEEEVKEKAAIRVGVSFMVILAFIIILYLVFKITGHDPFIKPRRNKFLKTNVYK